MYSIYDSIEETIVDLKKFREECGTEIETISEILIKAFSEGKKLLICGNGGSAADSQHLAAEFVSSFENGLARRPLPAIALTVDSSIITAISNDFNFELVFSRQLEALGRKGDVLLAISTSGRSKNCIKAVQAATSLGMVTTSLTRKDSPLYEMCDYSIGVPSTNTQKIQECHLVAYHILAGIVDTEFMAN